ncbi:MAG TPA: hypothetical protein VJ998_02980, partial [Pseudomonadales bacterium]|nr:hypothetical protein [Pseudomonadales bacterium]
MSEQLMIENPQSVDPWSIPLETMHVAQPLLFQQDAHWAWFKRLRQEAPVHYCPDSPMGPYWSVTRYKDIFEVDTNHQVFSSANGITIGGAAGGARQAQPQEQQPTAGDEDKKQQEGQQQQQQWGGFSMFIAMDPPKHDLQRATVSSIVAPPSLAQLEGTIRERAGKILDSLPRGETFNWVDLVSIELTTQMLATLFDFPFEDRRKLTRWSDLATAGPAMGIAPEQRRAELLQCLEYFTRLWNERVQQPPKNDLISMLAHGESTRNMAPFEFLGNL